jgi:hypothetical protein
MIVAQELRIGNWYNHNGEHCQVSPNTILEVWESPRKWVQPIPITPEILEKCGFVRNDTACYFGLGNYYIYYQIKTSVVGIAIINDDDSLDADEELSVDLKIKHLHQLQNLYFALTNTELNYTP